MENNEVLQAILSEIKGMNQRMDGMQTDIHGMNQRMDEMQTDIHGMSQRMDKMDQRFDTLEQGQAKLEQEITKINVFKIENNINKKLDLLFEGQQGMMERFVKQDEMDAKLDALLVDTHALRETVSGHTAQLKAIK